MNRQRTILIVDDIPKNIQLVAQNLKPLGYRLLFATSGKKALDLLEENKVDLVLLDIMMPEMNGYETCKEIKKIDAYSNLPVIFLTAKNEVADIIEGFDAGGSDYITKPFHSQELIKRVRTHLELKIHRDKMQQSQKQLQELVHILSHDLKNSLSGITMTMDLAKLENKQLDVYSQRIRDMADNGLSLIDLAKTMLMMEEKPFVLKATDLSDCLEQSMAILNPLIESKMIHLTIRKEEDHSVLAEPTSLVNSVLNNILTNAIKFSEEKSELQLTIRRENKWIALRLRDFGMGIPEKMQENLFNIHKSVSREGTKGEKGTGFGLSLLKKFMDAYGGDVTIKSSTEETEAFPRGTEITLYFLKS